MVPCQPSPARSPVASWACSASSSVPGRDLVHGRPQAAGQLGVEVVGGVPAGHVGHVDPPAVQVVGGPQPAPGDRVGASQQPAAQLGRVEAELRQAGVPEPALVLVVLGAGEVEELPFRRAGVLQRPAEPGVGVAAVVGGQVAEQAPAPGVDRLGEAGQGLVAAQQRVDLLEGGGVVAVVGLGREERRQVEGVDAQAGQVVEVLGDAVQVPAVELPPAVPGGDDRVVPGGGPGPGRRRPPVRPRRAGEPVGEDLVDDGVAGPGGRRRGGGEQEVAGVGDVVGVDAGAVAPAVAPRAAVRAGTGSRSAGCAP